MKIVRISDFGPVKKASVTLDKNIQVLIGAQASGKSTICKVVYFCRKIRDYTLDFLMNSEQFTSNHPNEYFNNYLKYLTKQFMGCFGTTKHMQHFQIAYEFESGSIGITLNEDGFVRFHIGGKLRSEIFEMIQDSSELFNRTMKSEQLYSILDRMTAMAMMKTQLRKDLNEAFYDDAEIIYIPAGRSLLATMSEQLHGFSITDMDLTMQEFINLILATKNKFGAKIPDMVKNYTKTVKGQINNAAIDQAYLLIRQILKADYTSENDGEKIYFDRNQWVKLMFGSSGQQEALWILMLVFSAILENKKTFMVVEEPEAHLFPIAQKDILSLIALMVNVTASQVIITTHSPYILTSLNILLYSGRVENAVKGKRLPVIPRNLRLSGETAEAYKVEQNTTGESNMKSLLDKRSNLVSTEYIDEVSEITNRELEELMDMEIQNDL